MRWSIRAGKDGTEVESITERVAFSPERDWIDVRTDKGNEYRVLVASKKQVGVNVYRRTPEGLIPCPDGTWS